MVHPCGHRLAVIDALASLNLSYPEVGEEKRKELAAVKRALKKNDLSSPLDPGLDHRYAHLALAGAASAGVGVAEVHAPSV